MNITDIAKHRYSTKVFDPNKKIPADEFKKIASLFRLSPSSVNSQPWHFIIAERDEAKQRVAKGTQGLYVFNETKVMDASHVVVCCAKTDMSDDYLNRLLEQEECDGRFAEEAFKETVQKGRNHFVNLHRHDLKDVQDWMEKQLYLNMGTVLLGAATMGIDAVPIEGVDRKALNDEFGLNQKGYNAVALIAFGYRADSDFNASLPKSRLPESDIITLLG